MKQVHRGEGKLCCQAIRVVAAASSRPQVPNKSPEVADSFVKGQGTLCPSHIGPFGPGQTTWQPHGALVLAVPAPGHPWPQLTPEPGWEPGLGQDEHQCLQEQAVGFPDGRGVCVCTYVRTATMQGDPKNGNHNNHRGC